MKETKKGKEEKEEKVKTSKKAKHKAKLSIGDIIFRVVILVIIFLIATITYIFCLEQIKQENTLTSLDTVTIDTPIKDKS